MSGQRTPAGAVAQMTARRRRSPVPSRLLAVTRPNPRHSYHGALTVHRTPADRSPASADRSDRSPHLVRANTTGQADTTGQGDLGAVPAAEDRSLADSAR